MGRCEILCNGSRLVVEDGDAKEATASAHQFHLVDGVPSTQLTSVVKIALHTDNNDNQCFLLAYGFPSRVHEHSAVCFGGMLAVLVGSFVVCIQSSLDEINWYRDCNAGACFGLYLIENESSLIVHCELAITRLTTDGAVEWQTTGQDVFTEAFELDSERIHVTDFYGGEYVILLANGEATFVRRGSRPEK